MEIVKAEILFSRKCNLNCSYCNMANGKENILSIESWKLGMDQLKKLDCQFIAVYGAEPLLEFDKLLEVVPYAESIGIDTTIITNGTVPNTKSKLLRLYNAGARSLSMSYDPIPLDKSSSIKSDKAVNLLTWFKNLGNNVRDVAAIATVTKENFMSLPDMVHKMSRLGIWTFYDLYHHDRFQEGSKTKGYDPKYAFLTEEDCNKLYTVLDYVNDLKQEGCLVHTNSEYLKKLKENGYSILRKYNWNCATYKEFPSWVTVDCDGSVYPCDDFQPQRIQPFSVLEIYENWEYFKKEMRKAVLNGCPGCCWNTHIGAHAIKSGKESIEDYIHGRK